MEMLKINGYTVTVEGTWYEVSNGIDVVAYGNCEPGMTPQTVYDRLVQRGDLPV